MPGTMPTGFVLLLIAFYQGRFFMPILFFALPSGVALLQAAAINGVSVAHYSLC